jgi:hypothetical protein
VKPRLEWWLLAACTVGPRPAAAQQDSADILVQARARIRERNLDSAVVLLRAVTDSTTWSDSARRIEAFLLAGIVHYYRGDDSSSTVAFREALELRPDLVVTQLGGLDSALAALFERTRAVLRGPPLDTIYSCSPRCRGLDVEPVLLNPGGPGSVVVSMALPGPPVATRLNAGSALLRAVIDTAGLVEPGSEMVVYSTLPDAVLQALLQSLRAARYRPGRAHGHAVRVLIERRVN